MNYNTILYFMDFAGFQLTLNLNMFPFLLFLFLIFKEK